MTSFEILYALERFHYSIKRAKKSINFLKKAQKTVKNFIFCIAIAKKMCYNENNNE